MLGLRRRLPLLQRAIMDRASAHGVTQECAASHFECSPARVSFWTTSGPRWQAMTLADLLGLIELTGDPLAILRPLHDALGLVAITRPTSEGEVGGRLESGVLSVQVQLGEVARSVQASLADGALDPNERAHLVRVATELRHQAEQLATLLEVAEVPSRPMVVRGLAP